MSIDGYYKPTFYVMSNISDILLYVYVYVCIQDAYPAYAVGGSLI